MPWADIERYLPAYFAAITCYGVFSIVLNTLVIYLIVRHSPPEMRVYRWYILTYQVFSSVADAFMSIFYLPVPLYPSNALTSYGLLQRFFGVRSFYCMAFVSSMTSGSAVAGLCCAAYRYQSMLDSNSALRLRTATLGRISACLIALSVIVPEVLYLQCDVDQSVAREWYRQTKPEYAWILDVPNASFLSAELNPWLDVFIAFSGISGTIVVLAIFVITVATFRLGRRRQFSMSRHTYRLHRLFTIVLVVQLLIPFAIVGAPNFVTVTLLQARIQNVTPVFLFNLCLTSTHSSISAFILLAMVRGYRTQLRRLLCFALSKQPVGPSASVQNSTPANTSRLRHSVPQIMFVVFRRGSHRERRGTINRQSGFPSNSQSIAQN